MTVLFGALTTASVTGVVVSVVILVSELRRSK